jgi:hypothetical protein
MFCLFFTAVAGNQSQRRSQTYQRFFRPADILGVPQAIKGFGWSDQG